MNNNDYNPAGAGSALPVQTMTLVKPSLLRPRHLEIHRNGQAILRVDVNAGLTAATQVTISAAANGAIVAAARLRNFVQGCRVHVGGNPDALPKEQWTMVQSEGITKAKFSFPVNRQMFAWKRTHDASLGAAMLGNGDYKLVFSGDERRVLAAYITNSALFSNRHVVGRIDWYGQFSQQDELTFLAAILGIEERIRRNKRAAAGMTASSA